ncbi:MAG: hypothetical protein Q7R34_06340, partial [Dehalococcoidia bacterium]|nr:hypothetical protein [Dehalococcoidia bacterium]
FQLTSWDLGPLVRDKWVRIIIGLHTSDDTSANSPGWVKIWADGTTPDDQAAINVAKDAPTAEYHGITWRKQSKSVFGYHPVGWDGPYGGGVNYGVTASNTTLRAGDTPVNSLTPESGRAANEHPPHYGRPIYAAYPGFYRNTGGFGAVGPYIRYYFAGNYRRLSFENAAAVFGNSIPQAGPTTYPSSGSITLKYDATSGSKFSGFSDNSAFANKPTGTNIAYKIRTSCDQTTWSAWVTINPTNPGSAAIPEGRYLELQSDLSTTDTTKTPTIDKLSINHEPTSACSPTQTKTWDSQADFDSGTKDKVSTNSDGIFGLTGTAGGGIGRTLPNVDLQTYDYISAAYNYDGLGTDKYCQQGGWLMATSPTTPWFIGGGSPGRLLWLYPPTDGRTISGGGSPSDEWWIAFDHYFDSSQWRQSLGGIYLNFHSVAGTPGDDNPYNDGVSPIHLQFMRGGNHNPGDAGYAWEHQLNLRGEQGDNGVRGPANYRLLPSPSMDQWHSYLMYVVFGRTDGTTPRPGQVELWIDGQKVSFSYWQGDAATGREIPLGTTLSNVNTIRYAPGSGGGATPRLQYLTQVWQGGPYTLGDNASGAYYSPNGSCRPIGAANFTGKTAAALIGKTAQETLNDTPINPVTWGTVHSPGQPNYGDSKLTPAAIKRNTANFITPAELAGSGTSTTTYPSTGSLTLSHDAGQGSHFSGFVPTLSGTLPSGTNVTYEARTACDEASLGSKPWVPVDTVPDGRYLQLRANLSTSDPSKTPVVDKLSISHGAVSGVCDIPPDANNLAPNSSFEADPNLDYFTVAVTGATYSWASDAAHTGSKSLKIVSSAT